MVSFAHFGRRTEWPTPSIPLTLNRGNAGPGQVLHQSYQAKHYQEAIHSTAVLNAKRSGPLFGVE
jgi:hypothetical protein